MPLDGVPLSKQDRELALERIKAHLLEETGEEPGDLAAVMTLDWISEELAPLFYNAGIGAAQRALLHASDALDADLEATKRPLPAPRRMRD